MINKFCDLLGMEPLDHDYIFKSALDALAANDFNLAAFHLLTGLNAHNARDLDPYRIYCWLAGVYYLKKDIQKAIKYTMLARSIHTNNAKIELLYHKLLKNT